MRLCVDSDPAVRGVFATPFTLETARQAEMRYSLCRSLTIVATMRGAASGSSCFDLGSSSYAAVLRNDKYICLTEFCYKFLSSLELSIWHVRCRIVQSGARFESSCKNDPAEVGASIVYSPEHFLQDYQTFASDLLMNPTPKRWGWKDSWEHGYDRCRLGAVEIYFRVLQGSCRYYIATLSHFGVVCYITGLGT